MTLQNTRRGSRERRTAALLLAVAAGSILVLLSGSDAHVARQRCDAVVRTTGELVAAANGRAYEGRVICARAGEYGHITFRGRHHAKVTVRRYPNESAVLGEVDLAGVSNLRIEGFRFSSGGVDTNSSSSRGIEIVANRFEDYVGSALMTWGGDSDITFARNVVRNMRFNGEFWSGWGISAVGGDRGIRNLRVRYNTFTHTEQDAMEIGETYGGQIVGNEISDVRPPPGSGAHTDSLMLWANSRDFLIKDNRFQDGRGVLMSGSTSDVRMENNLIVRMQNLCHDAGPTGSSDAGVVRYTWIHNTIYDCGSGYNGGGSGGGYGFSSVGPATAGASNRAERNIFTSFSLGTAAQFAVEDYNVIVHGPRRGVHDIGTVPRFRDRVDYRPANLPFDAGYHRAPAGAHATARCAGLAGGRLARCRLSLELARRCGGTAKPQKRAVCRRRVRALARCRRIEGTGRRARHKRAVCRTKARRIGKHRKPRRR